MAMMNDYIVMFDNADFKYCYCKRESRYFVLGANGSEEISTGDALQAWVYYIQRVDTAVRRRITKAHQAEAARLQLTEDDFFGD